MNGNANGGMTLAYLRGEKDLLAERQRIVEIRRQFKGSGLAYWLREVKSRRVKAFWEMVSLLQKNSRMTLTEMSRRLNIPVSTLFDLMKEVEKHFRFGIILKDREWKTLAPCLPRKLELSYEFTTETEGEKEMPLSAFA